MRTGGLADVVPVARLLTAPTERGELADVATALVPANGLDVAVRLLLTHVVVAHGELWLAERDGVLDAAAVWAPPGMRPLLLDMQRVLARELPTQVRRRPAGRAQRRTVKAREVHASATEALSLVAETRASALLLGLAVAPHVPTAQHADLRRDLLSPVLDDPDHERVAAVCRRAHVRSTLRPLGFRTYATTTADAHPVLWVGVASAGTCRPRHTRHPAAGTQP